MNASTFVPQPGTGSLHLKTKHLDPTSGIKTVIWQGDVVFESGYRAQVIARGVSTQKAYECELRAFDEWSILAKFKLPFLGDAPYSETTVKFNKRTYKLRAAKALAKSSGKTYLMLRLPQVRDGMRAEEAVL